MKLFTVALIFKKYISKVSFEDIQRKSLSDSLRASPSATAQLLKNKVSHQIFLQIYSDLRYQFWIAWQGQWQLHRSKGIGNVLKHFFVTWTWLRQIWSIDWLLQTKRNWTRKSKKLSNWNSNTRSRKFRTRGCPRFDFFFHVEVILKSLPLMMFVRNVSSKKLRSTSSCTFI